MSVFRRLISVFRTRQLDQDLEDELRSHIEMRAEDNVDSGMPADQARLDALRRFGNELSLREQTRSTHLIVWVETVLQDVRYALRTLRKSPAFTIVAALSVALGVGINTAVFSLIDTMLFRQVKLADPTRLVSLYRVAASDDWSSFPMAVIAQLREQNHVFSGMAGWDVTTMAASLNGEPPESLRAGFYGGNYYSLLGVGTALGRTLTPEDDQPGATPAAMISYAYWQTRFSGDRNVLNRTISAKGVVFKIVGVTPADFTGLMVLDKAPDVALPLVWQPRFKLNDDDVAANIVARLQPGATVQQAATEMNLLFPRIPPESLGPDWAERIKRGMMTQSIDVRPRGRGDEWAWNDYKLRLTLLMSVVGLVLVIACANIANLLLARATARRKEIAVRLAIGAPRLRVVRQLFTESLLLGRDRRRGGVVAGSIRASRFIDVAANPRTVRAGLAHPCLRRVCLPDGRRILWPAPRFPRHTPGYRFQCKGMRRRKFIFRSRIKVWRRQVFGCVAGGSFISARHRYWASAKNSAQPRPRGSRLRSRERVAVLDLPDRGRLPGQQ